MFSPSIVTFFLLFALAIVSCVVIRFFKIIRRLQQENLQLQQKMLYWQRRYNQSLLQSEVKAMTFKEGEFEAVRPGEFAARIAEATGTFHLN